MRGFVLGGFMGVGKTTVGSALARRTGLPFVDTDAWLVERFGPISQQFARSGEAAFRRRELALIASLLDGVPRVVATGGGLWTVPRARALLPRLGERIVLQAPLPWLLARLPRDGARPLADDRVGDLYVARQRAYADADRVVDVTWRSVDAIVAEILGSAR